jgi:hypothetical protein
VTPLPAEQPGEGFAYFRWHCIELPWSLCRGINDSRLGFGLDACVLMWRRLRRG